MNLKNNRCLVVGASGLVGREIMQALSDAKNNFTALVRSPLHEPFAIVNQQLIDFSMPWADWNLPSADTLFCALGTTIKTAGSKEAFRSVDYDAVLNTAHAAKRAGVTKMALVSALGADASSRVFYIKTKGEIEDALIKLNFEQLVILRPSFLEGDRASLGQTARPGEALALAITKPLAFLIPKKYRSVSAQAVAHCMIKRLNANRQGVQIIESSQISNDQ